MGLSNTGQLSEGCLLRPVTISITNVVGQGGGLWGLLTLVRCHWAVRV